jgi:hypothetical protein
MTWVCAAGRAAGGALSGLSGAVEQDADMRSSDWRGLGLMQLLKRASKRCNSTSSSAFGLDLAIARLTSAGMSLYKLYVPG